MNKTPRGERARLITTSSPRTVWLEYAQQPFFFLIHGPAAAFDFHSLEVECVSQWKKWEWALETS
jgi:hypothetical protein